MNKLVYASIVIAAASTEIAAADPKPAWCGTQRFTTNVDLKQLTHPDPARVLEAIVLATCAPTPEAEANKATIEKARQAWSKRLALRDSDWADVVGEVFDTPRSEVTPSSPDPAKFTALDQFAVIEQGIPMHNGQGNLREPLYATDMFGAQLAEVGRVAFIKRCLDTRATPVEWAICQPDIDRLDVAKAFAEITADTAHDGHDKMYARFATLDVIAQLKPHPTAVQTLWKRDAAYQRMFTIAAQARTDWEAKLGTKLDLLALVARAESARLSRSRTAQAGCDKDTATALVAAIAATPAKTFEKLIDKRLEPETGVASKIGPLLVEVPLTNLAATAYVLCNSDGVADLLRWPLQATPGARGPRTYAFTRMLGEKLQLDDVDARIAWPSTDRIYDAPSGAITSRGGVIASAKLDGDTVLVKFEKLLIKRTECVESHATSKIYKLHPDGRVEYEQVCDKMGTVTHNDQWMDFSVNKKYLPLLKPGVRISVVDAPNNARTGDEVIATWANKTVETPNWLLGATLK